ncbi:interferon-related developmental regulator 2 [Anopheles stephensi]|uniref:interferon-related developmental regulator 2 n=1 Tax=Anopheles stephensi TaxID=30069 RepID=UPI001658A456|nr:interferon-related developmental regulator 2 [Anopheles stephensi]XP_035891797.1 interferon-related developmental regulator 2 [Anopheles stephensi]XP_035891808.1 interferon-related developmental regulator 2 [Anopheles stephensi]XP_035891816.1 interferon-related developmental regulator 2 [Anopheles stephensi]XP_035891824.1 interferon-related developmental regulator 2 [Anopheles stephensi]XP_035891834.1 interferon-related developmental regulator 2 [Anopheles stephensi]XP_035891840.1 interfer
MPRNRKKHTAADSWQQSNDQSDDETSNDNASTYSCHSETHLADGPNGSIESGESGESGSAAGGFEKYEEKLLQAIENASDKAQQTRINAFQIINEVLVHHYIPDFLEDRKVTLMDAVEKSLRRGKGVEQSWAARIIPLLVIQIEALEDIGELVTVLKPVLLSTAQDGSAAYDARAKCCAALGLLCFVGVDDFGEILPLMKVLQSIFAGSYLKGDNSPSGASNDAGALHSAALSAWSLLLTLLPPGEFVALMGGGTGTGVVPSVRNLVGMLQSPILDVRMVAGETLALMFELGRQHDDEFLEDELPDLIEAAQKLATDAHKYRAKRDRKVQRATFRDVLHYLEEDISPEIGIKFGRELLVLNTWAIHHQYTCLRNALGFGMNVHLAENVFVREVLQLGPKMDEPERLRKTVKAEQRFINAAAFKARTISRGKNRDKRSFALN